MSWIVVRCGVKSSWGREISSVIVFKLSFRCLPLDLTLASIEYSVDDWIWFFFIAEAVLWWSNHDKDGVLLPNAKWVGDGRNAVGFFSYSLLTMMEASWSAIYSRLLTREKRSFLNGTMHHTLDCLMYTDQARSDESPSVVQIGVLGTMCPVGHSHRLLVRLMIMIRMHFMISSPNFILIPLRYIYSVYVLATMLFIWWPMLVDNRRTLLSIRQCNRSDILAALNLFASSSLTRFCRINSCDRAHRLYSAAEPINPGTVHASLIFLDDPTVVHPYVVI
jgi:hypothetical protein